MSRPVQLSPAERIVPSGNVTCAVFCVCVAFSSEIVSVVRISRVVFSYEWCDDMDTLVFKNGGVFAPLVPTIHCKTCKDRRHKRMSAIEQEQEKGFVIIMLHKLRFKKVEY